MVAAHAASTSDRSAAFAVVRVRVVGSSVMVIATILPRKLRLRLKRGIGADGSGWIAELPGKVVIYGLGGFILGGWHKVGASCYPVTRAE